MINKINLQRTNRGISSVGWGIFLILYSPFIFSCNNSSIISDNLLSNENFNISLINDIEVSFYTIKYDSISTYSSNKITVGKQKQEGIGTIEYFGYLLPGLKSSTSAYDGIAINTNQFDSLILKLYVNVDYSDSLEGFTEIEVSHLDTELELRDDYKLYNTSAYIGGKTLSGSKRFKSNIKDGQDVSIRLSDELGSQLFNLMVNEDEIYDSNTDFKEFLKGFEISGIGEDDKVTSFYGDSTLLRLYYTYNSLSGPESKYFDFDFTSNQNIYYTYTSYESTIAALEQLKDFSDRLGSEYIEHHSVISGGSNLATVISFPSIRDLLLNDPSYIISSAELRIYPEINNSNREYSLPDNLTSYVVDKNNNSIQDNQFNVALYEDKDFQRDTYYSVDVTSMIRGLLTPNTNYDYSLLITIPASEIANSTSYLMIKDESLRSELIIYTIEN